MATQTKLKLQLLCSDSVAQLVEHLTFNQRVSGSNPDAITLIIKHLRRFGVSAFFYLPNNLPNKCSF